MTREEINNIIEKEGDYKEFTYMGIKCEIKRHPHLKHLCGYLSIPVEIYGKKDVIIEDNIVCHGGINYHVIKNNHHILGFDCGHAGDLVPYLYLDCELQIFFTNQIYRDMKFVKQELINIVTHLNYITDGFINSLHVKNIRNSKLKFLQNEHD